MTEWITANWIWLVLALGAGWFLLRRGGAGCGMGGHGRHDESAPMAKGLDTDVSTSTVNHEEHLTKGAGSTGRPRQRGGCC
ncbi:MAG TPA: hypothetical protein DD417_16250 [Elusimicrobia bacterium]|nr:MAG: hypothetical protein A2X53_13705 [Candidatus Rokubacteria bacterium GWA2_70_23]OGK88722.1 MAG: hypothetical protein A2X50_00865 [Candidatus Rokubacteria bacterium GWF2_70_14]HAM55819.1 hypothetical protein [Candidatus Rokubacteria bacterium]HBL18256.1 hypothetical protein [Elusimicrobiota bacterium]